MTSLKMNPRQEIKKRIREGNNFLITTHVNPEGDAIGSELALYYLLKKLGKRVKVINADSAPRNLGFLPGMKRIEQFQARDSGIRNVDGLFVLDVPNIERIGETRVFLSRASWVINIDHHVSNSKFGDINWIDKNASSVGEMIFGLYEGFGLALDYKVSLLLYTAILTDTGSFRYINTSSRTHKIVSQLLAQGVKPYKVYAQLFENNSLEKIRLLAAGLTTLRKKDALAWIEISRGIFTQSGARQEDLEGIIDYIRTLGGIKVAMVFQELEDGVVKVGFRSKDKKIDVNLIASHFGGGGHRMASGCKVKGSLQSVKRKVLKEVRRHLRD